MLEKNTENDRNINIYYRMILTCMIIYFMSKMLWDKYVPYLLEGASILVLAYGGAKFITGRHRKKMFNYIVLYVLFVIYIILFGFIKDDLNQLSRSLYEYCFYIFMAFGIAFYVSKTEINKCIPSIVRVGVAVSLASWYEFFTKKYIIRDLLTTYVTSAGKGFRAAGFSRSYLSHGVVLAFFAIVSAYYFFCFKKKKYLYLSVFFYLSILTTASRGPLVSATVSLLFMYFAFSYINTNSKSLAKKTGAVLLLLFILIVIIIFLTSDFKTGNDSIDFFLTRVRSIINWRSDAGNLGRLQYWARAMEWFKKEWLFGIGPSKTGSWGQGSIGVTESGVIKHLCELGMLGSLLYYFFVLGIVKNGFEVLKRKDKLFIILYISLIVIVLINDITLQSTEEIQVSFVLALGLGGIMDQMNISTPNLKFTHN